MESDCYSSIESKMNKLVDGIIAGNYRLESPLEEIMSSSLVEGKVDDTMGDAKTNLERLSIVKKCFPFKEFYLNIPPLDKLLVKSERIKCLMEDRMDRLHSNNNFEEALKCCDFALMFAPEIFLTSIYIKRMTLLIALGKFEFALKSTDILLSENISEEQKQELLKRKKQADALITEEKTTLTLQNDIGQRQSFYDEKIAKVFGQKADGKMLQVADCISVEWNPEKERHYVTNEDLEPGTTVIVDSAYVKIVTDHMTWQSKYCNTCLKNICCPILCRTCVFAIYCCEKCRLEDWNENGHVYECPLLPYIHAIEISRNIHLSLKTVCKAGPETLLDFYVKSKCDKTKSTTQNVNQSAELIPSDIYSHIASFKTHLRLSGLRFTVWMAISLSELLNSKTSFFNNIKASQRSKLGRFVATMLIQHAEAFRCNSVAICSDVDIPNIKGYYKHDGTAEQDIDVATGIFPFLNMMSHSCVPSIFRQTLPNGKIAIITNRKLKAGSEISLSYGLSFLKDHIWDRKLYFLKHYYFECTCVACVQEWPMFKDIQDSIKFLCPVCNNKDHGPSINLPFLHEFKKNFGKCSKCKITFELNMLKIEAERYKYMLKVANDYLMENKPLESMPLFINCIKYYQMKISQPSIQLSFAQSRFGDCFDFVVNKNKNPKIWAYQSVAVLRTARRRFCSIV